MFQKLKQKPRSLLIYDNQGVRNLGGAPGLELPRPMAKHCPLIYRVRLDPIVPDVAWSLQAWGKKAIKEYVN